MSIARCKGCRHDLFRSASVATGAVSFVGRSSFSDNAQRVWNYGTLTVQDGEWADSKNPVMLVARDPGGRDRKMRAARVWKNFS